MPVRAIDPLPVPGDFRVGTLGVWLASNDRRAVNIGTIRSAMPANQRNNPTLVVAAAQAALQAQLDVRTPRSSLPDDEPTKTVDPARPSFFWDGLDLVGRSVIVGLTWNGSGFVLELTRAVA